MYKNKTFKMEKSALKMKIIKTRKYMQIPERERERESHLNSRII